MRLLLVARPKDGEALNLRGVIAMRRGDLDAAIGAFKRAVAAQPRNAGLHLNLGNAFLRSDQIEAALEHYETATRLRPGYADAEALKGDVLRKLGRWPEAALTYERALRRQADHFAALNGYGLCLLRDGDAVRAVEMLSQALEKLPPGEDGRRANILANLGSAQLQAGDAVEGLAALAQAAALNPESDEIAHLLAQNLRHVRAVPTGAAFMAALQGLLERSDISPRNLASAIVVALKSDPDVSAAIQALAAARDGQIDEGHLQRLGTSRVLSALLKRTPIPDQEIELALTNMRRHFLLNASSRESRLELVCALAQQCYLNEYVYSLSAEEDEALASLANETLSGSDGVDWSLLATTACYAPLRRFESMDRDQAPRCVAALFTQQIDEPAQERAYAASVQALTPVANAVSKAVQSQYEENPYPRWSGFSWRAPRPFREAMRETLPHLTESQLPNTDAPRVLVAGCGTGLETMKVVASYQTASVLAVDLSRASLAYGMRKLGEHGVSGVEHGQGDILELGQLDSRFDLIHSFGVIHHMSEPQRGLDVLAHLLDPGGFLFVGLYSAIARKAVNRVRDVIKQQGIAPTPDGIRALRRQIMLGEADPQLSILASPASDFWTMSNCRDLMFHVEEHQFTLPQIEDMFERAGLEFLGLEVPHGPDLVRFRQENPAPSDLTSLGAWHRFEERHPEVFGGTYQLWARKAPT